VGLESELPAFIEVKFSNDFVWDDGQVQEDHDHVRLGAFDSDGSLGDVAIIADIISKAIFNKLLSLTHISTNVPKQILVLSVR